MKIADVSICKASAQHNIGRFTQIFLQYFNQSIDQLADQQMYCCK